LALGNDESISDIFIDKFSFCENPYINGNLSTLNDIASMYKPESHFETSSMYSFRSSSSLSF
jgi:hypothetical protein